MTATGLHGAIVQTCTGCLRGVYGVWLCACPANHWLCINCHQHATPAAPCPAVEQQSYAT